MPLPSSPEIEAIRDESRALSAALRCIDGPLSNEARSAIETVYADYYVTDAETRLVHMAMSKLLRIDREPDPNQPAGPFDMSIANRDQSEVDQIIFEVVADAWAAWAFQSGTDEALADLRSIEVPQGEGRALHLMALHPWLLAVTALLENDPEEARRQYRRATELGAQLGTESNPAIQWTYAATFTSGG